MAKKALAKDAQPSGLYLLFFTELWERFGFYTLQAIIILYMTQGLLMQDTEANLQYAAFSSLLYITPMIGGYLADKYLGFQRAIILGGFLFIIAYFLCASQSKEIFFYGLSVLICANGFFKPNVSSIVGELYEKDDPRRDGGFTIFYMGINVGALIPPLIAGALVAKFGWHSGFYVAAIGMIIGQLIFQLGRKKYLGTRGAYPESSHSHRLTPLISFLIVVGLVITIALCRLAFSHPLATNYLVEIATVLLILVFSHFLLKEPAAQRKKLIAALILIFISIGFWALYNQAFTSLMLFASRNMDKSFIGLPFDAEATQFFNPFFIIILSPILSRFWIRLSHKNLNPNTQLKFLLSMFFLSGGFLSLAFSAPMFNQSGLVSPWLLVLSYFLQTIGELLISPIGLAMITVLSPKHLVGMMMGVWFFAQAASFAIGGFLANIAAVPDQSSGLASLPIYSHAFLIYGLIGLGMAFVTLLLLPLLNRLTRG